jgi:hypothetical protein
VLASARMSIRPEPSVPAAPGFEAGASLGTGAELASFARLPSVNSTELSLRSASSFLSSTAGFASVANASTLLVENIASARAGASSSGRRTASSSIVPNAAHSSIPSRHTSASSSSSPAAWRRCSSALSNGPDCSPSTTRCHSPAGASGGSTGSGAAPFTTRIALHFLQRILNTLPATRSSAIEYFVPHASHRIFIAHLQRERSPRPARCTCIAGLEGSDPQASRPLEIFFGFSKRRAVEGLSVAVQPPTRGVVRTRPNGSRGSRRRPPVATASAPTRDPRSRERCPLAPAACRSHRARSSS